MCVHVCVCMYVCIYIYIYATSFLVSVRRARGNHRPNAVEADRRRKLSPDLPAHLSSVVVTAFRAWDPQPGSQRRRRGWASRFKPSTELTTPQCKDCLFVCAYAHIHSFACRHTHTHTHTHTQTHTQSYDTEENREQAVWDLSRIDLLSC